MAVNVLLTWTNASVTLTGQRIEVSVNGGTTFTPIENGAVSALERECTHIPALEQAGDIHYRVVSIGAGGVEAVSETLVVSSVPADGDVVAPTNLEGTVVVE